VKIKTPHDLPLRIVAADVLCLCSAAAFGARILEPCPSLTSGEVGSMRLRPVSAAAAAAAVLILTTGMTKAQSYNYPSNDDRYVNLMAPRGGGYANYSPIPKTQVSFPGNYSPGTIVVNTTERRLYLVLGDGQALRYGIGVGRIGYTWAGTTAVSAKREWPDWTPPGQMLRRRPDLPRHMKGGIENPLGARAMYLGSSLYRIHGSNEPETIGQAVSSGCFRMTNDDVIDLYARVKVGSKVIVLR
jgi:lipoprotein-anchoring transpeptidase ErfK/SrfK